MNRRQPKTTHLPKTPLFRSHLLPKKMVLVFRAFASSSPVAGSASLLTNFKTQEKVGVTYSPGASLVNETYTIPAELHEGVSPQMIKYSATHHSATRSLIPTPQH